MRLTVLSPLRLSLLVVLLVVPVAPAVAAPGIDWRPCDPGFDCATVSVPLDHDQPRGEQIQLALIRKPATGAKIGTLFLNPGGPGASGVDFVRRRGELFSANTQGRFDVVGFDPRGIGQSTPLRCFGSMEEQAKFFEGVPVFPYRADQERPFFDRYRSLSACARQPIAAHMSTADVVRDLDLLRQRVGDRKLTYAGFSYGTYIGTTYANLFPRNIRALVVDGVLNPELWSSGRQIQSDRVATQEVFDEFLRLCDEARCAFHGAGGSAARWERLVAFAEKQPVQVGAQQVTYDQLLGTVLQATYAPERWKETAAYLDTVADAAETGVAGVAAAVDYDNMFDAYNGNACADIEYPHTFAAMKAGGRYAAAGSRFGPVWWWSNAACADWPVNADRYTGPWNARTSAPVLVVGTYFDTATDYRGSQAVARQLDGRLLSYAGWGHTAYRRNKCVSDHVDRYLVTLELPAVGTVCAAEPNPFR